MNKTKKNMILFLVGKLVSLFGTRIYGFAMSLYILKVTGSALNFAITILLSTVPSLIFGPIGGVIADKLDRKKMVLLTDFFSGVIMFVAFLLSQIYGLQLFIIYISTIFLSILNTLFSTGFDAALPNLVDDDKLGKINSYNQAINSLSSIIAPILGGVIYALVPATYFILFNGVSFVLSAISESFIEFYWKVDRKVQKINIKEVNFFDDIKNGFNYIKKKSDLMIVLEACLFINFLFTALAVSIPHLLVVQFAVSDKAYGGIEAAFGVGSLLMSILFANKLGKFKPIKTGIYLMILASSFILCSIPLIFILLATIPNFVPIYYGVVNFIIGSIIILINIPLVVYIQETSDDEYRGRVMALVTTIASAITPLGFLLHGLILDFIPTWIIIIYAGAGVCLISLRMIIKFNHTEVKDHNRQELTKQVVPAEN
ncbi:MAG: MFS transporter [Vallitalea sp.]|nr:MFS transporter [Vallitalea sp.]